MSRHNMISSLVLAVVLTALPLCDVNAGGFGMEHNRRRGSVENYLAFSLSAGYSSLLMYDKTAKPYGFGGGMAGLGYEMRAGGFWWSVAGEAECLTSSIGIDKALVTDQASGFDIARWRECPHYLFASVPLMFGYCNDKFYIGAGPKLMLALYCHDISYIIYASGTQEQKNTATANLQNNLLNAAACLETGGTVLDTYVGGASGGRKRYMYSVSRTGLKLKLGFYAEYGFTNINATTGTSGVVRVCDRSLETIPLLTSNTPTDSRVFPLYVGMKLTLLYGK